MVRKTKWDFKLDQFVAEAKPLVKMTDTHSLKVLRSFFNKLKGNPSGIQMILKALQSGGVDRGVCLCVTRNSDERCKIDNARGWQWLHYAKVLRFGAALDANKRDSAIPFGDCCAPFTLSTAADICINPYHIELKGTATGEQESHIPTPTTATPTTTTHSTATTDTTPTTTKATAGVKKDIPTTDETTSATTNPTPTTTTSTPASPASANIPANDGETVVKLILFDKSLLQFGWEKELPTSCGLFNLGHSCFLNSDLQCLSAIPPLVQYLLKYHTTADCKSVPRGNCIYCMLRQHIVTALRSKDPIKPVAIYNQIKRFLPNYVPNEQQDGHELLSGIFLEMQRDSLSPYTDQELTLVDPHSTPVFSIFGGMGSTQLTCCKCQHTLNNIDTFTILPVAISTEIHSSTVIDPKTKRQQVALEDCLSGLTTPEIVDFNCRCGHNESVRMWTIKDVPNVLTIQLLKFTFDRASQRYIPVNTDVIVPEFIDLASLCGQPKSESQSYVLRTLVRHSGQTAKSGHYTAASRDCKGGWKLADDSQVYPVNEIDAFGSSAMGSPYVLFYVRLDNSSAKSEPTKPVQTADFTNEDRDTSDTEESFSGVESDSTSCETTSDTTVVNRLTLEFLTQIEAKEYLLATQTTAKMIESINSENVTLLLKFAKDKRLWLVKRACRKFMSNPKVVGRDSKGKSCLIT